MRLFLLHFIMLVTQTSLADNTFELGDQVEVYSTEWKKPCYPEDIPNVCGKVGTVLGPSQEHWTGCFAYSVRFELQSGPVVTSYCGVHLKKVSKSKNN